MVVEENGGCMDSHLQKYKVSFVFTEGGGSEIFLHGFLSDHSLFFFSVGDVVRWNVSLAEMVKRRRRRRRNDGWPQRTHTQTQSQGCYRVWKEAEQVSGRGREGGRKERRKGSRQGLTRRHAKKDILSERRRRWGGWKWRTERRKKEQKFCLFAEYKKHCILCVAVAFNFTL